MLVGHLAGALEKLRAVGVAIAHTAVAVAARGTVASGPIAAGAAVTTALRAGPLTSARGLTAATAAGAARELLHRLTGDLRVVGQAQPAASALTVDLDGTRVVERGTAIYEQLLLH